MESDLCVEIVTYSDDETGPGEDQQPYEALSYHWGPGPADKPVYIIEQEPMTFKLDMRKIAWLKTFVSDYDKGRRFYIRPNLDKALRYLRHKTVPIALWVDAICINQSDEEGEKPTQISKMKTTYHQASNVCIWLGDGKNEKEDRTRDFHAAMDFSQRIIQLKELEELSQDVTKAKSWSDLLDLMRCTWFSRRWVIQELALAREATVHCADKHIPWQEFSDAIGLFDLKFDQIRALFRQAKEDQIFRNYESFNKLEPLGAKMLVDAVTNTFRRSVDDTIFEPLSNLETLVSSLPSFESSDPRDTIYALLNISTESQARDTEVVTPPKPDYKRNILQVYTDFLEWVVFSSSSLDIICRPWAMPERTKPGGRKSPTPLTPLPSWIQTIAKSPWGFQDQAFNGRINGDSIVGKAGRRRYNASAGKQPAVRFGGRPRVQLSLQSPRRAKAGPPDPTQGDADNALKDCPTGNRTLQHRLYVKGLQIAHVEWASGPISGGVIPKKCLEKGGWGYNQEGSARVPDTLWRTLVADRTSEGENPPPLYHRAALHCMALTDNNGNIGTSRLLDRANPMNGKLPQVVTEYLKRMQAVTWNRKFLEADQRTMNGLERLFGLGPPDLENNDIICILFGCSVPCILRSCSCDKDFKHFQFVGEAYIHGRMDGEAISMLGEAELKDKTTEFVIV
jgi:hypothetical protein